MNERRDYIRHPVNVPIQIYPQAQSLLTDVQMSDISNGGISFHTHMALPAGTLIIVAIPHMQPPFEEVCMVCWKKPEEGGFEIGVRFLDQAGLFKARMVEQVCYIEDYRRQERSRGRELSLEESAREWVYKYAEDFGLN